jgi:hypothetical protein
MIIWKWFARQTPRICLEGLSKIMKTLVHENRCSSLDSNQKAPNYVSRTLPLCEF